MVTTLMETSLERDLGHVILMEINRDRIPQMEFKERLDDFKDQVQP